MLQSSYQSDKSTLTAQADNEKRRIPMWGRLVGALLLMGVVGLALWNVADSGVVSSVSMHEEISLTGVQQKEGIKYGDWVSLQNGYASWRGGFLDTRDKSAAGKCTAEFLCVSTAVTTDRDRNSGRWVITSATGKAKGSFVKNGDLILLENMFSGGGGYLDVNTRGCTGLGPDGHCVSTSKSANRDRNSGTWKVIADKWVTDITSFTQVRLQNYFNNFNGGYLDINGNGCFGNLHCVATATGPTRHGGSTYWRMFRNPPQ